MTVSHQPRLPKRRFKMVPLSPYKIFDQVTFVAENSFVSHRPKTFNNHDKVIKVQSAFLQRSRRNCKKSNFGKMVAVVAAR